MKHLIGLCCSVATVAGLAACSTSNDGGSTPTGMGDLRLVNGISDTGTPIDASAGSVSTNLNAGFGSGSGFVAVISGSYKVTITAQAVGGPPVDIIDDNVSLDHDVQTSIYAVGVLGDSSQTSFNVTRPTRSFGTGQSEVQFVNASSATGLTPGLLNVYLVTPGSGLGGIGAPAGSFTPVELRSQLDTNAGDQATPVAGNPVLINSGSYEVIVTGPDSGAALYDSGAGAGIPFTSGETLQIAIMDATPGEVAQYGAGLQLVLMDNSSGSSNAYFNGAH